MLQKEPQIGIEPMTARLQPRNPQAVSLDTSEGSTANGLGASPKTAQNGDTSGNQMATALDRASVLRIAREMGERRVVRGCDGLFRVRAV